MWPMFLIFLHFMRYATLPLAQSSTLTALHSVHVLFAFRSQFQLHSSCFVFPLSSKLKRDKEWYHAVTRTKYDSWHMPFTQCCLRYVFANHNATHVEEMCSHIQLRYWILAQPHSIRKDFMRYAAVTYVTYWLWPPSLCLHSSSSTFLLLSWNVIRNDMYIIRY